MASDLPSTHDSHHWLRADARDAPTPRPALVLVWSLDEPERVGEVAFVPSGGGVLGRGGGDDALGLVRQRPGLTEPTGPLGGRAVSRRQLAVRPTPDGLELQNLGRLELRLRGVPCAGGVARRGDLVTVDRAAVFLVVERLDPWPAPASPLPPFGPFGRADAVGLVGESPAAWSLRERLAFLGPRDLHVLVLGPSGSGKELAARALHTSSPRRAGPWVARNASTLPEGLVDAELFGHVADYPNRGMPARPGLIGEADGGTLFLDELGELPQGLQARLLRVLDAGGEYQRLGEARRRQSRLRLVGATNRAAAELKHDLAARLTLRLELPTLSERPEDVPLLAQHLLREALTDGALAARFADDRGMARVSPALMEALVLHPYTHHARELHGVLWASLASSPAHYLDLTDGVRARLLPPRAGGWADWIGTPAADLPADVVQACLDAHNGQQESAWRALGLESRHQLARLIGRHGLTVRKQRP